MKASQDQLSVKNISIVLSLTVCKGIKTVIVTSSTIPFFSSIYHIKGSG